jgi:hypothetical protein
MTPRAGADARANDYLSSFVAVKDIGTLSGVILECRDPASLAAFYSQLTRLPVQYSDSDWYSIVESLRANFHLSFQRSPTHQPPSWPDPASSMQIHLHFRVDDIDAAEGRVLALGASKSTTSQRRALRESSAIQPVCLVPHQDSDD